MEREIKENKREQIEKAGRENERKKKSKMRKLRLKVG